MKAPITMMEYSTDGPHNIWGNKKVNCLFEHIDLREAFLSTHILSGQYCISFILAGGFVLATKLKLCLR